MSLKDNQISIVDTTLRDGSHAVGHSFSTEWVAQIAEGLDSSGIEYIEISHGDGLGGSSINFGFSKTDEMDLIQAASKVIKYARLTVLLIPGIGTIDDMKRARDHGAQTVRIATHVTEADISKQHIEVAKKIGMEAVGFLMMVHSTNPEKILEQALLMESYGADYINLADSAGYLLPSGVKNRCEKVLEKLGIPIGFHAHNNLGLAIANSLTAIECGAKYIDATLRGLGAGAGNTQLELLAAILKREAIKPKMDYYQLMDLAEIVVEPLMQRPQVIGNASIMLGYAGVYSSFLLHTYKAAQKFNLDPRDILFELGRRKMVGGQEDMIVDVAYQLTKQ